MTVLMNLARAYHHAAIKHCAGYSSEDDTHKWTVLECCEDACQRYNLPGFEKLMELTLENQWNEILDWADSVKK